MYYNNVYNFKLETNLTTALKNIIMEKLDDSTYVHLKEMYIGYKGRSVWEFMNHLLITYRGEADDMVKANLAALTETFDCTVAHQLNNSTYDKMKFETSQLDQRVPSQTNGGYFTGITNKAFFKWQARSTA